ncbi:MAG: Hsp20/alpha crystallin family protein [Candidatus Omnitrophica bacterium]|nr:Hsp20/alpha crystallin family protein [Candidatus Omnitrophota bacterium]
MRFDKKYSILPNFYSQSNQWDPFKEMDRLQKEMNRMFKDSFWRGAGLSNFERGHVFDLDADIKEKKDAYIIKLDIPGMDKSDINIELQDHNLIISGEKSGDVEENKENEFYKRERSFGYFSRAIPLPQNASDKNIQVDYKKGVLTIKIPKESDRKESIAKKQIFVK